MRITAHLFCLAASLVAAPAFAQVGKETQPASEAPQTLAPTGQTAAGQASPGFNFGIKRGDTERTLIGVAPIQKDELELTWKPASNWGLSLDLTSRSQNDLFPREEMTAGVTYQVTPRLRLGGGVTVKGNDLADTIAKQTTGNFGRDAGEAQVRIESAFSF